VLGDVEIADGRGKVDARAAAVGVRTAVVVVKSVIWRGLGVHAQLGLPHTSTSPGIDGRPARSDAHLFRAKKKDRKKRKK
jgi:hypothetical protein